MLKGISHPDDAARALELGVDAIAVSNHGGDRLDCVSASLTLLNRIRAAAGAGPVLFTDGGIRRGPDLIKALAVGADFCFVGRPFLYGVAAHGSDGARRTIEILKREYLYTRAMIGWAEGPRPGPDQLVRRPFHHQENDR